MNELFRCIPLVKLGVLLLAFFIYACAAPRMATTPVRDFLFSGQHPNDGYGAYGYFLFLREPDDASQPRYLAACASFMRNLAPREEYNQADPSQLMPTFSLLKDRLQGSSNSTTSCPALVQRYDFARAKPLPAQLAS